MSSSPQSTSVKADEVEFLSPSSEEISKHLHNYNLSISSTKRTPEKQQSLINQGKTKATNSLHLSNSAIDFIGSSSDKKRFLNDMKEKYGDSITEALDEGTHGHIGWKGNNVSNVKESEVEFLDDSPIQKTSQTPKTVYQPDSKVDNLFSYLNKQNSPSSITQTENVKPEEVQFIKPSIQTQPKKQKPFPDEKLWKGFELSKQKGDLVSMGGFAAQLKQKGWEVGGEGSTLYVKPSKESGYSFNENTQSPEFSLQGYKDKKNELRNSLLKGEVNPPNEPEKPLLPFLDHKGIDSKTTDYVKGIVQRIGLPTNAQEMIHLGGQIKNTLDLMLHISTLTPQTDMSKIKETIPYQLAEFQLSPLQRAEEMRKAKGLGVVESWFDPEIVSQSGLALIPGLGPLASQMGRELDNKDWTGASQTAFAMLIPLFHEKLKVLKDSGKLKDIKMVKNGPITSFSDIDRTIYINQLKIEQAAKEGRNPVTAIEEGLNHETGHLIVDNPTIEQKNLLVKTANEVLEPKEAEKFNTKIEKGETIDRDKDKELYKSEEKVVEEITNTGRTLAENVESQNQPTILKDQSGEEVELQPDTKEARDISNESGVINPQLANAMSGGIAKFLQTDVAQGIKSFSEMLKEGLSLISPKSFSNKEGLDALMKMKGEREFSSAQLSLSMQEVKKAFEKSPNQDNIDFMDRLKTGKPQPTPELQIIADLYRKLDDDLYAEIKKYKPSATYLDNHFRILWKTIPGSPQAQGLVNSFKSLLSKRPLQGSRSFLKKHTLSDVTEGLQKGGIPISYNPQTLMEFTYADSMKYITAHRMWDELKNIGLRKFVKRGYKIPDGFRPISDTIANVYFPAQSGQGLIHAGTWVVEDTTARLLENHLSRDYIRESQIGRGIVGAKNLMTMVELGFSAFHAAFEGIESVGSQIGLGLRELGNLGIRGNPKYLLEGSKKILSSPAAPYTTARLGGNAIKYIKNPVEFVKTLRGQSFLKSFPDAENLIRDIFIGGGQIHMNENYRTQWYQSMKDSWKEGNYIGAAVFRSPIAATEKLMLPLFDKYIPRLKMGTFLQEYSTALVENESLLNSGKITRPELARKTWDFVEDRFGEMNFDNLFWKNTFKTASQVMFRSISWKVGNLRASLGAVPQQLISGGKSLGRKEVPQLSPKMAWLSGMTLTTVAMAAIISKSKTGKYPWEWAKDDPESNLVKEVVFPRISKDDPTKRISTPTYWKDMFHLQHDPKGYISSSLSTFVRDSVDVWNNKDFQGQWVYNPNDPLTKETLDVIKHFFPTPFALQQGSIEGFMGITKAPNYITNPTRTRAFEKLEEMKQMKKKLIQENKKSQ